MNKLQVTQCYEFETMSLMQQMQALQQDGVYIGKLKLSLGTKLLYQWQAIYVEITYAKHRKEVQNIYCFTDTDILDRYVASPGFESDSQKPITGP